MSTRNLFVLIIFTVAFTSTPADAGFGDWLFGRSATPYTAGYAPYAAGYTPYAAGSAPYAAGYAPTQVSAGYPALTYPAQVQSFNNPSVYTGRPVVMAPGAPTTAYRLPISGSVAPLGGLGVAAPVTTGMNSAYRPVLGTGVAQTSYAAPVGGIGTGLTFAPRSVNGGEVPLGRVLRRANTSSNPFYGTGNIYPDNFGPTSAATTPYRAAYPAVAQATALSPTGVAPATFAPTTLAPTTLAPSVSPLFPNAPQPRVGGLARFFGSLLGTRYRSAYSPAQITYYRPQTSVDPVLGTTVTVQQPCSSYVQQLQRTPYNAYQPFAGSGVTPIGAPTPAAGIGCQTALPLAQAPQTFAQPYGPTAQAYGIAGPPSSYGSPGFGAVPVGPPTAVGSGVGQVGAIGSPSDRSVIPIPSTAAPSASFQPNTAPLTGGSRAADQQDTGQPRLESARPSQEDSYRDGLYRSDVTPFADEDEQYKTYRQPREIEPSPAMRERLKQSTLPEFNSPAVNYGPLQTRRETQRNTRPDTPQLSAPPLPPSNWQPRKPAAEDLVTQTPALPNEVTDSTQRHTDMRPIQAPDDFKSPFEARDYSTLKLPSEQALPATQRQIRSLGETERFPSEISHRSTVAPIGVTVPVREATTRSHTARRSSNNTVQQTQFQQPAPQQTTRRQPARQPVRDSGGWLPMSGR